MARRRQTTPTPPDLRERILADFAALKVPLTARHSGRGCRTSNSCTG